MTPDEKGLATRVTARIREAAYVAGLSARVGLMPAIYLHVDHLPAGVQQAVATDLAEGPGVQSWRFQPLPITDDLVTVAYYGDDEVLGVFFTTEHVATHLGGAS